MMKKTMIEDFRDAIKRADSDQMAVIPQSLYDEIRTSVSYYYDYSTNRHFFYGFEFEISQEAKTFRFKDHKKGLP